MEYLMTDACLPALTLGATAMLIAVIIAMLRAERPHRPNNLVSHHLHIAKSLAEARKMATSEPPYIGNFTIFTDGESFAWGSQEAAERFGFVRTAETWRHGARLD